MATLASHTLRNPQSVSRKSQSQRGFSLLDLLVVLLVLTVILLAAVKQFGSYQQPTPTPAPPTQAAPSQ